MEISWINNSLPLFQLDHLLGRTGIFTGQKQIEGAESLYGFSSHQIASLSQLSRLPAFADILKKVASNIDFGNWVVLDNPELSVPILWNDDDKLSKLSTF